MVLLSISYHPCSGQPNTQQISVKDKEIERWQRNAGAPQDHSLEEEKRKIFRKKEKL